MVRAQALGREWSAGCDSPGAPGRWGPVCHRERFGLLFWGDEMLLGFEQRLPLSDEDSRAFLLAGVETRIRGMKAEAGMAVRRRLLVAR